MPRRSRPARALATASVLAISAALLSGCVPEYFAKINAGQARVDEAITAAGLDESVEAEYSCTGALPFTATTCRAQVTATTDDLAVIERAADVEVLRAEADGGRWTVIYRGTTYQGEADALSDLGSVADGLPADVTIDRISLSDGYAGVSLTDVADFEQLCEIDRALPFPGGVTSRVDGQTDLTVDLDAVGTSSVDDACELGDEAIESLGFSTLMRVGIEPDQTGGLSLTIIPNSEDALDAARDWAESVPVPEGVDLRVPTYIE